MAQNTAQRNHRTEHWIIIFYCRTWEGAPCGIYCQNDNTDFVNLESRYIGVCEKEWTTQDFTKRCEHERSPKCPRHRGKERGEIDSLGYPTLESLRDADPNDLYLCASAIEEQQLDKCVLYAFCYAVAYAKDPAPNPQQYRWWNSAMRIENKSKQRRRYVLLGDIVFRGIVLYYDIIPVSAQ